MTLIDLLIPYYVRFTYGFSILGIAIGIMNFGMLAATLITVKGIYIPSWMIGFVIGLVILFCTIVGFYFEKYNVWNRIASHQNQNMNPEIKKMHNDIYDIKKLLENGK